jgi:hypothetical protein
MKLLWKLIFILKIKKNIYDVMAVKTFDTSLTQKEKTKKLVTSLSSLTTLVDNRMWHHYRNGV